MLLLLLLRTMLLLSHLPFYSLSSFTLLTFCSPRFWLLVLLLLLLLLLCSLIHTYTDTNRHKHTHPKAHLIRRVCLRAKHMYKWHLSHCVCIVTHNRYTHLNIYVYVIEIYRIDLHSADTVTPEKPHTFRFIYFIHAPHHPTHLSRVEWSSGRGSAEQSRGKCIKMLCLLYFWQLSR